MTMLTLTAGTAFIMWLGEQITERGIGNGISLIIFAGIVARMPAAVVDHDRSWSRPARSSVLVLVLLVAVHGRWSSAVIIFMERGQRRIPVQYAKRDGRAGKMYGGQSTHLPLKVNTAGVIPPIFASSILHVPGARIASFIDSAVACKRIAELPAAAAAGSTTLLYVGLIIFFCYFYTAVTFNPVDVADNMKKYGGFIPGIRPGKKTAEYIDRVLTRITFGGALYVVGGLRAADHPDPASSTCRSTSAARRC